MIDKPNILLLGSTGRNVGKTEFACRLIRRFASHNVIAVKITVIREQDHCPRGGEGCGVCGSHDGNFSITEELRTDADKDTMRMKFAGAARVYWLRTRQSCLAEAITELLSRLPQNAPVICESNSARHVISPGLFLMIAEYGLCPSFVVVASAATDICNATEASVAAEATTTNASSGFQAESGQNKKLATDGAQMNTDKTSPASICVHLCPICGNNSSVQKMKPSSLSVLHYADAIIHFANNNWDIDPDQVQFANGRWSLPQDAGAIVLVGGQSRRMGRDKSLLDFNGQPLIYHIVDQLRPLFPNILIGANDPHKYRFLNLPIVPDRQPDQGPLMGILSTLAQSPHERNFIVGCDIPFIHRPFVRHMISLATDADIVMPITADGRHEPLYAIYRRSIIPAAERLLNHGKRRIIELFDHARVRFVPLPPGDWYRNLNTPQEYQSAVQHLTPESHNQKVATDGAQMNTDKTARNEICVHLCPICGKNSFSNHS